MRTSRTPSTDAWPAQRGAPEFVDALWLDRPPPGAAAGPPAADFVDRQVEAVLARAGEAVDVVAPSAGATAALLAAQRSPGRVRSLVLFEPVCFALARGRAAVEEHVRALTPVPARAGCARCPRPGPSTSTRPWSGGRRRWS